MLIKCCYMCEQQQALAGPILLTGTVQLLTQVKH